MTGLSLVKSWSKSVSLKPCGCSVLGCSLIRSTTLTTRIFSSGRCSRIMETAASVSSVGTSPQQAMTTSGARPWSLLAHGQIPVFGRKWDHSNLRADDDLDTTRQGLLLQHVEAVVASDPCRTTAASRARTHEHLFMDGPRNRNP